MKFGGSFVPNSRISLVHKYYLTTLLFVTYYNATKGTLNTKLSL